MEIKPGDPLRAAAPAFASHAPNLEVHESPFDAEKARFSEGAFGGVLDARAGFAAGRADGIAGRLEMQVQRIACGYFKTGERVAGIHDLPQALGAGAERRTGEQGLNERAFFFRATASDFKRFLRRRYFYIFFIDYYNILW